MTNRSDDDQYRVVLLTKAGVGDTKRKVLKQLTRTNGITVVGIVVEDMIHGSLPAYASSALRKLIRYRGRGYPVRMFYAARDVLSTAGRYLLPEDHKAVEDSEATGTDILSDIPVIEVSDMTSDRTVTRIQALSPDLGIVWGTRILPRHIFAIPTDGSIGIHSGKIPEYRGGPAAFWELYYGEQEAGVTVQKLNEDLDAGQIVSQETVSIGAGDSLNDVRDRQQTITTHLVVDSVVGLANGTLEPHDWTGEKRKVNTPPTIAESLRFCLRQWGRQLFR